MKVLWNKILEGPSELVITGLAEAWMVSLFCRKHAQAMGPRKPRSRATARTKDKRRLGLSIENVDVYESCKSSGQLSGGKQESSDGQMQPRLGVQVRQVSDSKIQAGKPVDSQWQS